MNKIKKHGQSKKALIVGLATSAVAFLATSPQLVKADKLSCSQRISKSSTVLDRQAKSTIKSIRAVKRAEPALSKKQSAAFSTKSSVSIKAADEATVSNDSQADANVKTANSSAITEKDLATKTSATVAWNENSQLEYENGTLTISSNGQAVINPVQIERALSADGKVSGDAVTRIVVKDNLVLSGSVQSLFANLPNLTAISGLEKLDTRQVNDMSYMFSQTAVTNLNLTSFNTENVTTMEHMFADCTQLESLDLTNFDTKAVRDSGMNSMFNNCSALSSLNIASFNTEGLTSLDEMFSNCHQLTRLDVSHFNTKKVTSMRSMFYGCSSLTSLDVSGFDTKSVDSVYGMFAGCENLHSLDLRNFDLEKAAANSYGTAGMLSGLTKLNTIALGEHSKLYQTWFNTPGTWQNVGTGTETNPQGNIKRSSSEMQNDFDPATEHDTFVRVGTVQVDFETSDGQKIPRVNSEEVKGKTGELGTIAAKSIQGYKVVDKRIVKPQPNGGVELQEVDEDPTNLADPDDPNDPTKFNTYFGDFGEDQKVTFIYQPDPTETVANGQITVSYQDEKGNRLQEDQILRGKIGEHYQTQAKSFPDYLLVNLPSNASGTYTESPQTVKYVYRKIIPADVATATVIVRYQDEQQHDLLPAEQVNGNVGDGYAVSAKEINGYTLKFRPNNEVGFFSLEPQIVVYVYAKNAPDAPESTAPEPLQPDKHHQDQGKHDPRNPHDQDQPEPFGSPKQRQVKEIDDVKKDDKTLPRTDNDQQEQTALLLLGVLSTFTSAIVAWFKRRRNS